jgi:hypothetical protein
MRRFTRSSAAQNNSISFYRADKHGFGGTLRHEVRRGILSLPASVVRHNELDLSPLEVALPDVVKRAAGQVTSVEGSLHVRVFSQIMPFVDGADDLKAAEECAKFIPTNDDEDVLFIAIQHRGNIGRAILCAYCGGEGDKLIIRKNQELRLVIHHQNFDDLR